MTNASMNTSNLSEDGYSDFGMDELEYDQELEDAIRTAESQTQTQVDPKVTSSTSGVLDIEDLPLTLPPPRLNASSWSSVEGSEVVPDVEAMDVDGVEDPEEGMSLFNRFRRKGFLSVSDLVGPVWCETQYDYRLRTLPFLPPSQRPSFIMSTAGKEISVDQVKVEGKERILRRGEKIHKRLEREIHPQEVVVTATTREDVWGLRFLNMLSAIEALLTLGKCREMPVVGFVNGIMVMGIIDEITRQPLATTPPKPETRSSRQTALTSFFAPTKPRPEFPVHHEKTHKLSISDSKTRASGTLPRDEDTLAGKLQVMMYKEMLDAILLSSSTNSHSSTPSQVAESSDRARSILPSRNPFSWNAIFDHLKLDPSALFSDEFMTQSHAIIIGNGLRWGAEVARCLTDMTNVWDCYVEQLGLGTNEQSSRPSKTAKSKGKEREKKTLGKTEDLLELVYRRAGGASKEKKDRSGTGRRKRRRKVTEGKQVAADDKVEGQPPPRLGSQAVEGNEQVLEEEERLIQLAVAESLSATANPHVDELYQRIVDPTSKSEASLTSEDNAIPKRPSTRNSERALWSEERDSDEQKEDDELAWALEMSLEPLAGTEIGEGKEGEQVVVPTCSSQLSGPAFGSGSNGESKISSYTQLGEIEGDVHVITSDEDDHRSLTSSPPRSSSVLNDKPGESSGSIIGKTRFTHSPTLLAAHLESVLQFWMGEREPQGVSLEETRRCGWCEFEEGCEWR
ncbi:hypothetical protein IAR55_001310 [Kwoniella newhampshirensis]|uniref:Exonuclease V n=1 Tax=Kwoniella newhampshirensis TaxID=1651941 RepID=A0AAW0Z5D3_9TREE